MKEKYKQNCDSYYKDAYGRLYETIESGEYINFEYSSVIGTVIHPFIKRPVPYLIKGKQYFDIVTPYGYGGPLILESADLGTNCKLKLMKEFMDSFEKYCGANDIIAEFIRFHTLYENASYTPVSNDECNNGYQVIFNRHAVAIDLSDSDFFVTQFDSKCRNMVRKAEKLGVKIETDPELNTIDTFADLYYGTMEHDSADDYYFFNRDYFHEIRDNLKGECLIVNAVYDRNIVASSLFLYTEGGYAHYHLSATNPQHYSLAANNLILKVACEEFLKRSCTWLHLGGGLSSSPNDRLLAFKKSFGRLDKNRKSFYIGKKIWNVDIYKEVMEKYINLGGEPNSFFPEYRG